METDEQLDEKTRAVLMAGMQELDKLEDHPSRYAMVLSWLTYALEIHISERESPVEQMILVRAMSERFAKEVLLSPERFLADFNADFKACGECAACKAAGVDAASKAGKEEVSQGDN